MNYNEIIKLLDAGYSREEILAMSEEPKPEEPKPENNEMTEMLKEMRDMFGEMKKEFTAMNILNSQRPPETERTSEEIIANIISPKQKKKGDK